jgi:hypothetical protein
LFGLAGKWRRHSQDRLQRLAKSIEAIEERDRQMADESSQVDKLRDDGAAALYGLCREFVDNLNRRLPEPALLLDPPEWTRESFHESGPNLIQISLRGRLLQLEYEATDEPFCTEDFRYRYVLRGDVRSFNQNFLEHDTVDEQQIFYCPGNDGDEGASWHFFEVRTYRTGKVSLDYLASELERLL